MQNYLSFAREAAEKINNSVEAIQQINGMIEAKNRAKRGPAPMCFVLADLFGDDLHTFPVPNTKQKDVSENELWDIHEEMATDPTTGKQKTIRRSFYKELFFSTEKGASLLAEKEKLVERVKAKEVDPTYSDSEARRINAAIQAGADLIATSVNCLKALAKAQELEGVTVDFHMVPELVNGKRTGEKVLVPGTDTILAIDKTSVTSFRSMTVSQFLGFDLDAAIANGGTWEAFIAQKGKRAAQAAETKTGIRTGEALQEYVNELASFLQEAEGKKLLLKTLSAKDAMEFKIAIVKLAQELDVIVSNDAYGINKDYKAIEALANSIEKQAA